LQWAIAPVPWHVPTLVDSAKAGAWGSVQEALGDAKEDSVGHILKDAMGTAESGRREALLQEAALELQGAAEQWGRLPKVIARLATTVSFLLATALMRQGLQGVGEGGDSGEALNGVLRGALDIVCIGIAVTSMAFAVHSECQRRQRLFAKATDELLELTAALSPEVRDPSNAGEAP
jgi:hypothetical protein